MKTPVHGGRIFEAASTLNCHWREILDFSANINPLGYPKGLKEHLFDNFDLILHYPETHGQSLAEKFAQQYQVKPEQLLIGSGSTVQMHLLMRRLLPKNPIIIAPAFAEYEEALTASDLQATYFCTKETDNWKITKETIDSLWQKKPDLVFVANPANPTGQSIEPEILEKLTKEAHQQKVWLVIDEAFLDFTPASEYSQIKKILEHPRLIILKSLTKIYALPGLRLAFMACGKEVLPYLKGRLEPWNTSALALEAGFFCLEQKEFINQTKTELKILKNIFQNELKDLNIGQIYPSSTNYLLVKLHKANETDKLIHYLFTKKILLRDAANFVGLEKGFLRFAIRPKEEFEILLDYLKKFRDL